MANATPLRHLLASSAVFLALNAICENFPFLATGLTWIGVIIASIWIAWQLPKWLHFEEKVKPYNKAVLITGCDTGFGNLLARGLDTLGFQVFAGCLNPVSSQLEAQLSSRAHVFKLDVTCSESVSEAVTLVASVTQTRGTRLWAVVNNAGVSNYSAIEWGLSTHEIFGKLLEVNTLGSVRVTRAFLPLLRKTRDSRVILMSSMAGRFAFPGMVPYAMTKHAIRAFGDGLRRELANCHSKCKVIIIEPAMYTTQLTESTSNLASLNHNWDTTSEDVKKSVGGNQLSEIKDLVDYYLGARRDDVTEVIEMMARAVVVRSPQIYYRVCGFRQSATFYLMEFLPEEFVDILLSNQFLKTWGTFSKLLSAKRDLN